MNSINNIQIPEPLSPSVTESFAYHTIQSRFPEIVTKAIDTFHRLWKTFDPSGDEDAKNILHELSKFRYELMTDKPLDPLEVKTAQDFEQWTIATDDEKKRVSPKDLSWFTGAWLFIECYGYRKIADIFMCSEKFSSYDVFNEQKCNSLISNMDSIRKLVPFLYDKSVESLTWLELSLWGNRCDLSLKPTTPSYNDILGDLDSLRRNIIVNDTDAIIRRILDLKSTAAKGSIKIDIVMDNAGFECFTDICLMNHLTNLFGEQLDQIRIHVKCYPWFVSDVMVKDFHWILDHFTAKEERSSELKQLGSKWKDFLQNNKWKLIASPFWTTSYDYDSMKRVDPQLYQLLESSSLILFKGDLNYRKLLGDLNWPHDTPFATAIRSFRPNFLATLRTNKADLVCNLDPSMESSLPSDFMVTGEFAVVQVYDPVNK